MKLRVEINEDTLRNLVRDYLERTLGAASPDGVKDICIEVKSKQNYRSEWEKASFRAIYETSK